MKLKPLKDHVIVEEIKEEEEQKSGIIIPNASKESTTQGVVIGVGPGIYNNNGDLEKPPFKEGQTVLFPRGTGQKVELHDKNYVFFKPEDILAIVKV